MMQGTSKLERRHEGERGGFGLDVKDGFEIIDEGEEAADADDSPFQHIIEGEARRDADISIHSEYATSRWHEEGARVNPSCQTNISLWNVYPRFPDHPDSPHVIRRYGLGILIRIFPGTFWTSRVNEREMAGKSDPIHKSFGKSDACPYLKQRTSAVFLIERTLKTPFCRDIEPTLCRCDVWRK